MLYRDLLDTDELQQAVRAMNSRARQVGVSGRITVKGLRDRIMSSGGCCEWCGRGLVGEEFEVDHIISLSQGGHNTAGNLAVACPSCNRRKAGKNPVSFALEIVAETGRLTPLVKRMLDDADVVPRVQQGFFDDSAQSEPPASPDSDQQQDTDDAPPYRW